MVHYALILIRTNRPDERIVLCSIEEAIVEDPDDHMSLMDLLSNYADACIVEPRREAGEQIRTWHILVETA